MDIEKLKALNASRWAKATLTRKSEYNLPVSRALAAMPRYQQVSLRTGVHPYFIAVTHYREAAQNFSLSLAQGDPWSKVSTHVPKGRGPFSSWEDAAVDALVHCPPYAARNTVWSLPDVLTLLEMYNGLGYALKGVPSPYVWSGTDQYTKGKYIRDHVYDPNVIDKQLGVAGFLMCLIESQAFPPALAVPFVIPQDRPEGIIDEIWEWISNCLKTSDHG